MPNYPGKLSWFLLFILVCIADVHAQKESYNWYFGNKAGLSFSKSPPTILSDGKLSTQEGCATISDEKGNLLFYTDGITVYNRNHKIMLNGSGLKGSTTSTQSGVIVKIPGNDSLYYVFSMDAVEGAGNGLKYSVVNMKLDNGFGGIIDDKKNIHLIYTTTEKIIAIKHRNCKDIWIITCDKSNFYTFLLSESGISSLYKTTYAGPADISDRGYLRSAIDGSKIAVTLSKEGVRIYNFDISNGNLTFFFHPKNNILTGDVYGLEFSPKIKFLYSANRYSGKLIQHDLNTLTSTLIADSVILGALQNGPDGKLYVGQANTNFLGVIENPDSAGIKCNFRKNAVSLGLGTCRDGLPNFLIPCFEPSFYVSYKDTCLGAATLFSVYNTHPSATFKWKFNDSDAISDTSTLQNPSHLFSKTGIYEVRLIASAEDVTDTIILKLNIKYPFEPFPQKQVRICTDTYSGLTTGNPDATHIWENGQQAKTYWVNSPGFHKVTLLKDGCVLKDSIEVIIIDPVKPDLGNDLNLCAGEKITLDAGGNTDSYLWSTGDTIHKIIAEKTGKYWVRKKIGNCSASDTIIITYKDPVKLALGNDIKICANEQIMLDAGNNGDSYLWSTNDTIQNISVNKPGKYWVIKTKESCSVSDTILLSLKDTVILDLGKDSTYCGDEVVKLEAGANADAYIWSTSANTPTITVNKAGTYWVKRIKEGCISTDTITINFYPEPKNYLTDTALCENEDEIILLSAGEGKDFLWKPFGETDKSIFVKKAENYSVTYTDLNGCTQSKIFKVKSRCRNNLYLPNIFKPNSPFITNNIFKAQATNIQSFNLKIYNRWGELLFETDKIENGWDGRYKEKDCVEGVYLYLIQYSAIENGTLTNYYLDGTFTLLR